MSYRRSAVLSCGLTLLAAAPSLGQAPQFRAEVTQTGDSSFDGTFYFGGGRMRIEGISDGEEFTAIVDGPGNRMIVLMPDDQAYMTMDLGSAPFSAPAASTMDPANPCSSGELTECRSLGSENVNGYAARGWEYTRDGERETAWISNELRFPVRTVDADGTTTDFTNVQMGSQPAALFQPPNGWTEMDMTAMLGGFGGGFGGRGAVTGRGVPPGGRGAPPAGRGAPPAGMPAGGADPAAQLRAQLQAMGLPPEQIEMALAQLTAVGTATNSAPWEAIEAWVVDFVVTVEGRDSRELTEGLTLTETYSARYTATVPIPYGTPAVGAAVGAAWQVVPGLGSAAALAMPVTGSVTFQYHGETVRQPQVCNDVNGGDGYRTVTDARGSGELRQTDMSSMTTQARFELSGDLSTYNLLGGAVVEATEESRSTTTYMNRCPDSPAPETTTATRQRSVAPMVNVTGQPLPAAPGIIRGSGPMSIRLEIGEFSGDVDANAEWTLRPIQ